MTVNSYDSVDHAERERLILQLRAEKEALPAARSDLEYVARDIAILIEESSSKDDFFDAARQCRDLAVRLEELGAVWGDIEEQLDLTHFNKVKP